MAISSVATGLRAKKWDDQFFSEYVRANRFAKYMGNCENAVIHTKQNLTKGKGDAIVFALVNELNGLATTGANTLEGNEEALDTRSHEIKVDVLRHAVVMNELEEQTSAFALREAAKERLRHWAMKRLRDDIITALGSIDGTPYVTATLAAKNIWHGNNGDRVLYGLSTDNQVVGDHVASLLTIGSGAAGNSGADLMTPDMVSLAKHLAQTSDPAIHPVTVKNDQEWFVMFCNSRAFRDLKLNVAMQQSNREAWARGTENPLFNGGDLLWDGVIIKEIPEITVITGAASGGADVAPNYLCGAQALGIAWAQRTRTVTQDTDYKFKHGVAVQEIRGIEKLRFGTAPQTFDANGVLITDSDLINPKDHGVVTVFSAANPLATGI